MGEFGGVPREEKASRGWRIALGCGAGCLVLLVAAGVTCSLAWRHMRARATVDKHVSVLTGNEVLYARLYLSAKDPGMAALRAHLLEALQRMQEEASHGKRGGAFMGFPGDAELLPLRLEMRSYPPLQQGEKGPWVGEVDLSGGYNILATALRFVGRKEREVIGDSSLYHFTEREGERTEAWIGVAGNRILFAKRREVLVPLIDDSYAALPVAPPASVQGLVEATRLSSEDAVAWALDGEEVDAPWLRSGAVTLDLVDDERIAFRLALEVPASENREAMARIVAAWARDAVPEGLEVNLGEPEWIGPGTVRYTGEITGLSAALDDWFDTHMATRPRAPASP